VSHPHPFHEEKALPAGGLLVRLGSGHHPMTLRRSTLEALAGALAAWEGRPELRWVAFAAASPTTFLAGADFRELGVLDAEGAHAFSGMGQGFFRRLRASRLWMVACVGGACMGGGLDFALSCDYRIASPAARFSHPGPRLGLFTGWGGTAVLPRRSGVARAALLAGAVLSAREALAAGWVEEVAADPLRRAVARARASATMDLGRLKRLRRAEGLPLSVALEYERLLAVD
jgi:3-hydroxyacyl-CoA dehydrogenase / enoyl-CoA hydratase / 3-hydroxybutyryl-CoA epimerase